MGTLYDQHDPIYQRAKQLMLRHNLTGTWRTSVAEEDGVYLDGIGMMLDDIDFWREYFQLRVGSLRPVATGRSGAFILGMLGRGTLWNGSKGYGTEWANYPRHPEYKPESRTNHWPVLDQLGVVLVDDCRFTGSTMLALRAACAKQGMVVVKEVVAWPFQPL